MKHIAISVSIVFILLSSILEARLPELRIQDLGDSKPLKIKDVNIHVVQRGHLARTEWILTYQNSEKQDLRGDFIFPLPDQASVSDVGLYFGDQLRHGVVVEREQGRSAYEDVVHRRVDPALAEWSTTNLFRLDVYPIPAKGEKKIFVSYDQRLEISEEQFVYSLRLDSDRKLRNFELEIDSDENCSVNPKDAAISRHGVWHSKISNQVPPKEITLTCNAAETPEALVEENPEDGKFYVSVPLTVPIPRKEVKPAPAFLIFWDISGSMDNASKNWRNFIEALIATNPKATVTIVPFHFAVLDPVQVRSQIDSIQNVIQQQLSAGATDLVNLFQSSETLVKQQPEDTRTVLITDGNDSLNGDAEIIETFKKVNQIPWLIVAANDHSNNGLLQQLAEASGGSFVSDSILAQGRSALESTIMSFVPKLELWSGTQMPDDRIVHAIPLNANLQLVYLLGKVSRVNELEDITIKLTQGQTSSFIQKSYHYRMISDLPGLVRTDWARSRLQTMLGSSATDQQWIEFGKKFHLVTPETSLIVLESWQDYLRYEIEMPPDVRAEYERTIAPHKPVIQNTAEGTARRLGNGSIYGIVTDDKNFPLPGVSITLESESALSLTTTSDSKGAFRFGNLPAGTYSVEFSIEGFTNVRQEELRIENGSQMMLNAALKPSLTAEFTVLAEELTVVGETPLIDTNSTSSNTFYDFDSLEEVPSVRNPWRIIDQSAGIDSDQLNPAGSRNRSSNTIWNYDGVNSKNCSDFPDQFKTGSKSARKKLYIDARKNCLSVKPFYLESAEMFIQDDPEFSLRVLMDAVEFINSDSGIYRALSKKLQVWQRADLAEKVLWRAVRTSPEPQNSLELAHMYAQQGKISEARKLLNSALNNSETSRYQGLHQIIEAELLRAMKVSQGSSIHIDNDDTSGLTVLLSWDTNYIDIDLHVIEPGGEEVFYSHNNSAAGGRLLADNTAGYGPEIYTIANPQRGEYKIRIHYYSSDRTSTTQSATGIITIYQRNGTGEYVRQEFTVVFTGRSEDFEVAKIRFP